ncbi:MAG: GNAT family N-acetyltransferase [Oscillospiraceae bacterium]|nr:GNAT family N-acetyltransferase [Oscillospiraceae bacterium]
MNIYGERVLLRAIEKTDNALLLRLINDPATERMLGGSSFPVSCHAQESWTEQQKNAPNTLRCIIALRDQPEIGLGTVILSDVDQKNGTAQIHLKLDETARGKGYGTDAVNALTAYAFDEMRLQCLYADIVSYNTASEKLFVKCGYRLDGVLRSRIFKNGAYVDLKSYSRLKSDQR